MSDRDLAKFHLSIKQRDELVTICDRFEGPKHSAGMHCLHGTISAERKRHPALVIKRGA